jgi:hypothetical protein
MYIYIQQILYIHSSNTTSHPPPFCFSFYFYFEEGRERIGYKVFVVCKCILCIILDNLLYTQPLFAWGCLIGCI